MSKPKKVLKDFSELQPVEVRIEALAASIYRIAWRGEAERAFEPRQGTQIYRVWKMEKLDIRQQRAWYWFRRDIDNAQGKSGGVSASYGEYTDKTETDSFKIPKAYTNIYLKRVEEIFSRHLSRRDAALLFDLLQNDLQSGGDLNIEALGFFRSGYKDKASARAAGVAHIQNMLDRLADYYDNCRNF